MQCQTITTNKVTAHFPNGAILNRQEAKARLSRLQPSTKEHSKLQDVLTRTSGIVEISLPDYTYKVNVSPQIMGNSPLFEDLQKMRRTSQTNWWKPYTNRRKK